MKAKQKKKMLKAFVLGFVISAVIIAAFVLTANMFGMHFVMGFPLLFIEAESASDKTIIHVSWLLPLLVGLLFALFEGFSLV